MPSFDLVGRWARALGGFVIVSCAACSGATRTDGGTDATESAAVDVGAETPSDGPQDDAPGDAASVDAADGACVPNSGPGPHFEAHTLDGVYRNEGVGAFDVNGDGHPDIVTDQYWYDATTLAAHEIRTPVAYNPAAQFALGFGAYPLDVNRDGCVDLVAVPHVLDPFFWYENPCTVPGGTTGHWIQHVVEPAGVAGVETPFMTTSLFADGRSAVLTSDASPGQNVLGWYERPTDLTVPWPLHAISAPGFPGAAAFVHGIGEGDVNGDGRHDVLTGSGWFEQTTDPTNWPFHAFSFGPGTTACSRMWTYDVDQDSLADVICSRPHDVGLYWFQQMRASSTADPTFVSHLIDDTVSEMHALRLADLDGDGTPEIVSGTRWCSHCGAGAPFPDPSPGYVVYYQLRRTSGTVSFVRNVVDCSSGVGVAFDIADVDGDGRLDIVTAGKHGLFYFRQLP